MNPTIGAVVVTAFALVASAAWLGKDVVGKRFCVEAHYERRVSEIESNPVQPGDIVFVGDSLTEFAPWSEFFPQASVNNHGIAGDDAAGVLARLDGVIRGGPSQVFVLIGTNDLTAGVAEDQIVAAVDQIVARIGAGSPATQVFVQSVLPRAQPFTGQVAALNRRLRSTIAGGATWIDLHPHFAAADGSLRDDFSDDGVHLRPEGYRRWCELLAPHVAAGG